MPWKYVMEKPIIDVSWILLDFNRWCWDEINTHFFFNTKILESFLFTTVRVCHSYLQENTPHIFQGCLHSRPIPIIMKFSVKQQLSPHSFSRLAFIFVRLQQSRGNLLQLRTKIFRLMKNIEWHYRKWCVRAERASQECKFENNGKFIFTDSSKRYRNVPKSTVKNGIQ